MRLPVLQDKKTAYVVWGALAWLLVDFGTGGGFHPMYLPVLALIFLPIYVGFPLVRSHLIFDRNWRDWKLFAAMLVELFIIEILLVKNKLMMEFPAMIIGIPLSIGVYAVIVYFPLWIADNEVEQHKKTMIALSLLVLLITLISVVDKWKLLK